ncbi:MAG: phosphatidylglycerol lysyltransferase domain-containing protein [Candidatus Absconditabacterales bacterium]|jgi:hypothetical protein
MKKITINDFAMINKFYRKSNSTLGYSSVIGTYSTCLGHNIDLYYEIIEGEIAFYIMIDNTTKERSISPLYLGPNPSKGISVLKKYCLENNIHLGTYIDNNIVEYLKPHFNIQQSKESDYEVVYPIERFRNFDKIDTQKRRANIFFREYNNYQLIPYTKINQSDILELSDYWEKNSNHPTDNCDFIITKFFTNNFDSLSILGFLLLVDNKLVAYLFGELINNKTFIINIVKAKREYKGVYQALYNLVCNDKSLNNVSFVNGTNLTNCSGLKESKLRLKPTNFVIPWEFDLIF